MRVVQKWVGSLEDLC